MQSKTTTAPVIRVAQGSRDLAAVRALFVALQEHGRASDARLPAGEDIADGYLRAQRHKCDTHEGRWLVAEVDGDIVRYVCVLAKVPGHEPADGQPSLAEVVDLIVCAQARSAGIGKALLDAAQQHAAAAGAHTLRVTIFAANQSAGSFYEANGFKPHEVVYEKQLVPRGNH